MPKLKISVGAQETVLRVFCGGICSVPDRDSANALRATQVKSDKAALVTIASAFATHGTGPALAQVAWRFVVAVAAICQQPFEQKRYATLLTTDEIFFKVFVVFLYLRGTGSTYLSALKSPFGHSRASITLVKKLHSSYSVAEVVK